MTDTRVPKLVRSAFPGRLVRVGAASWVAEVQRVREAGGLLLSLWGSDQRDLGADFLMYAVLKDERGILILVLAVDKNLPGYPSLAAIFPAAARMQRATYDLLGIEAEQGDPCQWLRHASWPEGFPLRRDFDFAAQVDCAIEHYPFVRVEGEGVHEIPVGPVHAGIIEPGHFRFSIVGEKVLRLEERLGFTHKGIEKRFEQCALHLGHRIAARVSGDSAVAFSWAYCMAVEAICDVTPPPRALALRALALERERIANHLGDLGALGRDAGFSVGAVQFSRLKEDLLRLNASILGARYLFDEVIPGGVAHDLSDVGVAAFTDHLLRLKLELSSLRAVYDGHTGMQDRFVDTGCVDPQLAAHLGLAGLAGRASGQAHDLRCDLPLAPYDRLDVRKIVHRAGDVAARVSVRFDEVFESIRICLRLLNEQLGDTFAVSLSAGSSEVPSDIPAELAAEPPTQRRARSLDEPSRGAIQIELPMPPEGNLGVGVIEGWRGPVLVALEAGADGMIRRCHPHDPSWQNWPAIEHAVIGNIVPDFPLINKSFNLSYSGHDL